MHKKVNKNNNKPCSVIIVLLIVQLVQSSQSVNSFVRHGTVYLTEYTSHVPLKVPSTQILEKCRGLELGDGLQEFLGFQALDQEWSEESASLKQEAQEMVKTAHEVCGQFSRFFDDLLDGDSRVRERGWAEAVTAGIELVGGVFGYFTRQHAIHKLQQDLQKDKWQRMKAMSAVHKSLEGMESSIRHIRDKLRTDQVEKWIWELRLSVMKLQQETQSMMMGVEAALQGKLSPFLVSIKDLDRILDRLGPGHAYNPIASRASDLFDMPVTVAKQGKDLMVVLHVPKVDRTLALYRFIPVPIQWGSKVVEIKPTGNLLAVEGKTSFLTELSSEQLDECWRIHQDVVCQLTWAMTIANPTTCLEALYLSDEGAAAKFCEVKELESNTVRVIRDRVHIFVPEPTRLVEECAGAPGKTIILGEGVSSPPNGTQLFIQGRRLYGVKTSLPTLGRTRGD